MTKVCKCFVQDCRLTDIDVNSYESFIIYPLLVLAKVVEDVILLMIDMLKFVFLIK